MTILMTRFYYIRFTMRNLIIWAKCKHPYLRPSFLTAKFVFKADSFISKTAVYKQIIGEYQFKGSRNMRNGFIFPHEHQYLCSIKSMFSASYWKSMTASCLNSISFKIALGIKADFFISKHLFCSLGKFKINQLKMLLLCSFHCSLAVWMVSSEEEHWHYSIV